MKQPKASTSGKKALMQLRLAVARATVRYALDTRGNQPYIPDSTELSELCDEYALRALAIWLATTCGSHICRSSMSETCADKNNALLSAMVRTKEYPFANPIAEELEREIFLISQDLTNAGLAAQVELLGTLYESIVNQSLNINLENGVNVDFDIQTKERRRIVGQFYTPPLVVKYCFDIASGGNLPRLINSLKPAKSAAIWADGDSDIETGFKLLDPSAGTGNFLCGFIKYVKEKAAGADSANLYLLACNSIFANELDARAASLARLAVEITVANEISELCQESGLEKTCRQKCVPLYDRLHRQLRKHIVVTDSILHAANLHADSKPFDLVITNPPYVSFGARNQMTLNQGSARFLKQNYPEAAEYKVRYHSIFQDIAILYAATGGSIVLLVPDGFLTGSYYKKLRHLLRARSRIHSLTELPACIIPEAVVGRWCIAHYVKEHMDDYQVELCTFIDDRGAAHQSTDTLQSATKYSLPVSELHEKANNTFRLLFNKEDHELLRITDDLPRLRSMMSGYTGIRSLSGRNSITDRQQNSKSWRRGITSGAQVQRYLVTWSGDWINVNPELLFKGGFNEQIVENPKILVRQTGDCLVCAYDQSGLYHLNNVHSFSTQMKGDSGVDMVSMTAIMNSTLWRHIYRLQTRELGRALAQVDIDTVESMPFKPMNHSTTSKIALLANWIAELLVYFTIDPCQKADNLILFIDRSIDRLIYDAYELDSQIISRVESVSAKAKRKKVSTPTPMQIMNESIASTRAAHLIQASARIQFDSTNTAGHRLPTTEEIQEFIEEISWSKVQ